MTAALTTLVLLFLLSLAGYFIVQAIRRQAAARGSLVALEEELRVASTRLEYPTGSPSSFALDPRSTPEPRRPRKHGPDGRFLPHDPA